MLIAEVGNAHFGCIDSAIEHIRVAKYCGADAVKFQAFAPGDFEGSMPESFYEQCAFSFDQYKDLVEYGNKIDIPVFFSIFNIDLLELDNFTQYSKLAAWQTNEMTVDMLESIDDPTMIVSINSKCETLPLLKDSIILYATDYNCDDPAFERISIMQRFYKRPIGYSDHSEGIANCKEAIDLFQVPVIEKHFTLQKYVSFEGEVFRDTVHACNPTELKELATYFNEAKQTYKGVSDEMYSLQ